MDAETSCVGCFISTEYHLFKNYSITLSSFLSPIEVGKLNNCGGGGTIIITVTALNNLPNTPIYIICSCLLELLRGPLSL